MRQKGSRSIRGKLVLSEINKFIEERLVNLPDRAYDEYLKELKSYSGTAKAKLRGELTRAKTTKSGYEKKITNLSSGLSAVDDEKAKQVISRQIAEASQFVQEQEQLIRTTQQKIERSTLPAIDKEEFKSTLKEIAERLKAGDVFQKDIIAGNLFLKLYFDQQKMTRCILKEPFASLLEFSEFHHGGGGWD